MTQIKCGLCTNEISIFKSLLIDSTQACTETMMLLSLHIQQYHSEQFIKMVKKLQLLQLLIGTYLPILMYGSFEGFVDIEDNILATAMKSWKKEIELHLWGTQHISTPLTEPEN